MIAIHDTIWTKRVIHSEFRKVPEERNPGRVILRYDDSCGNGHNTFSITMESKAQHRGFYGGCMHDTIRKVFPEYTHLIQWHLMSTDGPLHYIANTLYHAEDNRIKAQASLESAKVKVEAYKKENALLPCGEHAEDYIKGLRKLETWVHIWSDRLVEAASPDLEAARCSAVAPHASLEQLQDEEWLRARLPELLNRFRSAMDDVFGEKG